MKNVEVQLRSYGAHLDELDGLDGLDGLNGRDGADPSVQRVAVLRPSNVFDSGSTQSKRRRARVAAVVGLTITAASVRIGVEAYAARGRRTQTVRFQMSDQGEGAKYLPQELPSGYAFDRIALLASFRPSNERREIVLGRVESDNRISNAVFITQSKDTFVVDGAGEKRNGKEFLFGDNGIGGVNHDVLTWGAGDCGTVKVMSVSVTNATAVLDALSCNSETISVVPPVGLAVLLDTPLEKQKEPMEVFYSNSSGRQFSVTSVGRRQLPEPLEDIYRRVIAKETVFPRLTVDGKLVFTSDSRTWSREWRWQQANGDLVVLMEMKRSHDNDRGLSDGEIQSLIASVRDVSDEEFAAQTVEVDGGTDVASVATTDATVDSGA